MQDNTRRTATGLVMVIGLALLLLLLLVVHIKHGKNVEVKKETPPKWKGVKTIAIDGYTYYQWSDGRKGYSAPTPDTIKRCVEEANR